MVAVAGVQEERRHQVVGLIAVAGVLGEVVNLLSVSVRKSSAPRSNLTFFRIKGVMSAGLVEPGLFFRPRRLALTSSRLHLSST